MREESKGRKILIRPQILTFNHTERTVADEILVMRSTGTTKHSTEEE